MEVLQLWAVLGFAVERLTELIVKVFPVIEKKEISAVKVPMLISVTIALVISLGTPELDLFKMLGVEYEFPYVGAVLSGLFMAGGSELIHKIIKKLEEKE